MGSSKIEDILYIRSVVSLRFNYEIWRYKLGFLHKRNEINERLGMEYVVTQNSGLYYRQGDVVMRYDIRKEQYDMSVGLCCKTTVAKQPLNDRVVTSS